ncbi:MAG: TatD family hydrolase [Leptospiraceae bacterium]|nr:TatD family hydrolase [Leptospiraceae bacterium]MDW8306037.1 TatD family hydrolase [Leptospiraceae bacterium]
MPVQVRPRVKRAIDSHCHIDLLHQKGFSEEEIFDKIKESDLVGVIQIAAHYESYSYSKKLAHRQDLPFEIWYSCGMHPHEALKADLVKSTEFIKAHREDKRLVAIGEIGLDYYYHPEQKEKDSAQKKVFAHFLGLAQELQMPVIIHTREAHEDTVAMLKDFQIPFLIHCFTGNAKQMEEYLELGGYISFSGIVTFKNALPIQEAARLCPPDRMLVETDAPYLAPVPLRGKVNFPSYLFHTIEFLATLCNTSSEELMYLSLRNTHNFFGLKEQQVEKPAVSS